MSDAPSESVGGDVLSRPASPPDRVLAYGSHPDQVIDLRLPGGRQPDTLVVLVHGGFWRAERDRTHLGPMAEALTRAGHLVAVPEFRRVGTPGGGWPGTFTDLAAAVDTLAARYPTARTVLVGHSSGGHLALWAAARHRLPADSPWYHRRRPDAVISLAGCSCLDLCDEWKLGEGAATALIGGSHTRHPDRYALADPSALLPLSVPTTLVHGTDDVRVPLAMSTGYAARAAAAGERVRVLELPGADHFAVIDPLSAAWPHVLAAVDLAARDA